MIGGRRAGNSLALWHWGQPLCPAVSPAVGPVLPYTRHTQGAALTRPGWYRWEGEGFKWRSAGYGIQMAGYGLGMSPTFASK